MENPDEDLATRNVLGDNIARLMQSREDLNSNPKLQERSGVGLGTISRIINGKTAATLDTLAILARTFGVEPWQLLVPDLDPSKVLVYQSMKTFVSTNAEQQTTTDNSRLGALKRSSQTLPVFTPGKTNAGNKRRSGGAL